MPVYQGNHSRVTRKQIFTALGGLFVLSLFLVVSIWLVIDSNNRLNLPTRKPPVPIPDKTNVAASTPENTNFTIECTSGDFAVTLTAAGSSSATPFSVTAQGQIITTNAITFQGNDVSNSYDTFITLRGYSCICPNVNQSSCGGVGDPSGACSQIPVVTGINAAGPAVAVTNVTSGCATIQSDVNFSSVQLTNQGDPNPLIGGFTCTYPNPANPAIPSEISSIA
ncbi:hypothetical protein KBB12_02085, partial [Candidatus Woesebacteria bacterium]|nr:hypothetical protein [Candidatus Woesebacteria bacterium]